MYNIEELESWDDDRLHKVAKEYGMANPGDSDRQTVYYHILDNQAISEAKELTKGGVNARLPHPSQTVRLRLPKTRSQGGRERSARVRAISFRPAA